MRRFVPAGLSVSLISASFASDDVAPGQRKLVEIEDVDILRELGLIYRRDRTCRTPQRRLSR